MQQQPKYTAPKHLSAIEFLLNQLLLPAISPSQKKKKSYNQNLCEMSWGKKFRNVSLNLKNYSLLSFSAVTEKISKIHNKSKCHSQNKMSNQKKVHKWKHVKKKFKKKSMLIKVLSLGNISSSSFSSLSYKGVYKLSLSLFLISFLFSHQFLKMLLSLSAKFPCLFSLCQIPILFSFHWNKFHTHIFFFSTIAQTLPSFIPENLILVRALPFNFFLTSIFPFPLLTKTTPH